MAIMGNVGRSYWKQHCLCRRCLHYNCTFGPYSESKVVGGPMWPMKLIRNDIGSALPYMLRKYNMEFQSSIKFFPIGEQMFHVNQMVSGFFSRIKFLWRMGAVRTAATINELIEYHDTPSIRTLYMFLAFQIKKGWSPDLNDLSDQSLRHPFFEQKHNIKLENFGLYKKGNSDWHVAGVSKLRYISIEDFMWCFFKIPGKYKKGIYNYMLKQQVCVLENSPVTLLKHPIVVCFWEAPVDGWYKLNVSGVFKETLGGTIEASFGAVLRDSRGTILEVTHKPLLGATSRYEVVLAGAYYGLDKILYWRSEAMKIILELDEKDIVFQLKSNMFGDPLPFSCLDSYMDTYKMLENFDDVKIRFQDPHGNSLANRVAYVASHLTAGQSFPICEIGYEIQVMCDKWKAPKYDIVPEKLCKVDDSFDDEVEEWCNNYEDEDVYAELSDVEEYPEEVL